MCETYARNMYKMKENRRQCAKCGISPNDDPRIHLHRFPIPGKRNSVRCEMWAKFCYPFESWQSEEFHLQLHSKHRMLCMRHFKKSWFVDPAGRRLFRAAVPDQECDMTMTPQEDVPSPSQRDEGSFVPLLEKTQELEDLNKMVEPKPQKQQHINKWQKFLNDCKKRLKKVYRLEQQIKNMKNKSYLNAIVKSDCVCDVFKSRISSKSALLLQGEIKYLKIKTNTRRWDTDSKIVALRLYMRSPTCYKLLRRMLSLPAPSTLRSLLSKFKLRTGINQELLTILKQTNTDRPSENEYVLMWDEMSIKMKLQYNQKEDMIEGFQDHAEQGRCPEVASYALVFMVAGIRKKVKQPIAFYLSAGSVTADRLTVLIKEVLLSCFRAGLNISATVCDMDGVNKRALSILGATAERPVASVGNKEVVTLFNTPDLLKSFRNMFLKHDIQCQIDITSGNRSEIGIAKWAHIKQFYHLDKDNQMFVFAPALTDEHLDPNTKQKQKVILAAQVLSHSVVVGMYAKISEGQLPTEAVVTANLLSNIDKLFDSVNASTTDLRRGKPLSTNLKNTTKHIALFADMKKFFNNLNFLGGRSAPAVQEGWVWTLNGLERLWKNLTLKHKGIKSLATRRLQKDPLENLFACIRSNCGARVITNPTAGQFIAGFKTSLLCNLSSCQNNVGNCEKDENDVIISNYKTLLKPVSVCTDNNYRDMQKDIDYVYEESMKEGDNSEFEASSYACGFIIKNNETVKTCGFCRKIFIADTRLAEHISIDFKEHDNIKRSFMYATKELIMCIEGSAKIINKYLENDAYKKNLMKNVSRMLHSSIDYSFLENCAAHKQSNLEYIKCSVFFICIKRFCSSRIHQLTDKNARASLESEIDTSNVPYIIFVECGNNSDVQ